MVPPGGELKQRVRLKYDLTSPVRYRVWTETLDRVRLDPTNSAVRHYYNGDTDQWRTEQRDYNHSTYIDLCIADLAGLGPTALIMGGVGLLAAATLGWVRVPQAPVEAVIALSILFVAMEIVHWKQGRPGITRRWRSRPAGCHISWPAVMIMPG